ncbi:hypothetical protein PG997_005296 [Apiospora hydei]|uniref:Uncharacterized protein n=1 Tax=Apiospora hydei TaxID=1337664 RepID=A0ABR1X4J2_9PEZI
MGITPSRVTRARTYVQRVSLTIIWLVELPPYLHMSPLLSASATGASPKKHQKRLERLRESHRYTGWSSIHCRINRDRPYWFFKGLAVWLLTSECLSHDESMTPIAFWSSYHVTGRPLTALEGAGSFYKGTITIYVEDRAVEFDISTYPQGTGRVESSGQPYTREWTHLGETARAHITGNVALTVYGLDMLHNDKPIIVFAPIDALRQAQTARDYQRAFCGVMPASSAWKWCPMQPPKTINMHGTWGREVEELVAILLGALVLRYAGGRPEPHGKQHGCNRSCQVGSQMSCSSFIGDILNEDDYLFRLVLKPTYETASKQ